jgi:uncharacterized membrane protein
MKIGTSRVENFSDGVISIIITIMVLTIKIPDFNHQSTPLSFHHHVKELVPYLLTYAFSFMMIGIFWTNHHHMFHLLEKTDERLLFINLVFLFWMSLIPVSTAMVSSNPTLPESAALYGCIMLMTTVFFAIMRTHTLRKKLVHHDQDKEVNREIQGVSIKARTKSIIGSIAYLCAIPLAYLNVYLSYCIMLIPPVIFFIPDGVDDERLAAKIGEKSS